MKVVPARDAEYEINSDSAPRPILSWHEFHLWNVMGSHFLAFGGGRFVASEDGNLINLGVFESPGAVFPTIWGRMWACVGSEN